MPDTPRQVWQRYIRLLARAYRASMESWALLASDPKGFPDHQDRLEDNAFDAISAAWQMAHTVDPGAAGLTADESKLTCALWDWVMRAFQQPRWMQPMEWPLAAYQHRRIIEAAGACNKAGLIEASIFLDQWSNVCDAWRQGPGVKFKTMRELLAVAYERGVSPEWRVGQDVSES